MKKIITTEQAEILLDRYYEGYTSVEEEQLLYIFLSQKNLPEKFDADKALLAYFATHKKKTKIRIIPLLRWTSVAASVIIGIMLITRFLMPVNYDSYAYIDGHKITNIEKVKEQMIASIQSWNNADTETNVDMDELIIQQLQLFK